jgi:DNA-damage-inducible protein J
MATIQVRIDEKPKKDLQKILRQIGLDVSSAIKLFIHQVIITESIPFPIRTENGFTPEQEREMIREEEEALKYGKRYSSAEELHRAILGEEYDEWVRQSMVHRRNKALSPRSKAPRTVRKTRHSQAQ